MRETDRNIENHHIDIPTGKIFETLKVPERYRRLCKLKSNVIKLDYSVNLLDMFINKSKSPMNKNQKVKKLIPLIYPKNLSKQMSTKKIVKFDSPINKQMNKYNSIDNINKTPQKKNNKIICKTDNSKKTKSIIKNFRNDHLKNNNSDIFVTDSNLPNIDDKKENNKKSKLYKMLFKDNNNNNSNSNSLKISKSSKKILPILNNKNINNNNKNNFNHFNKRYFNSPQSANKYSLFKRNQNENELIKQISNNNNYNNNINYFPTNPNIPDDNKNININQINNIYNSIETSSIHKMNFLRSNSKKDSQVKLPKIEKLNSMSKKNRKIIDNLKQSCFEYDLENWEMKSKFKYAEWKYGIADIQKYFIDLKEFGQKEESELAFRKSFFENVEEIVNEIKKTQEKRELLSNDNGKLYKGSIVLDEKENEYDRYELFEKKRMDLVKVMKKNEKRRNKEKIKKNVIDEILYQCKRGVNNINRSQTEI